MAFSFNGQDIEMKRGDSATINLNFKDGNGAAVDLTGGSILFTVKYNKDTDTDAQAFFQKAGSFSAAMGTAGSCQVIITSGNTVGSIITYDYDIELKTSGGDVHTVLEGRFNLVQDVTRT